MTDGINLDGFASVKPSAPVTIDGHYSDNTGSATPATDKSTQDGSGLGNGGK
jgi:hypothetical protein